MGTLYYGDILLMYLFYPSLFGYGGICDTAAFVTWEHFWHISLYGTGMFVMGAFMQGAFEPGTFEPGAENIGEGGGVGNSWFITRPRVSQGRFLLLLSPAQVQRGHLLLLRQEGGQHVAFPPITDLLSNYSFDMSFPICWNLALSKKARKVFLCPVGSIILRFLAWLEK